MNSGFRQRLVGAVVLLCAALILWPVIFSDSTPLLVDRRSQIPSMPEFEKYTVREPISPANIEPVVTRSKELEPITPDVKPIDKREPKAISVPEKPSLDDRSIPKSWVLQIASFSQEKNAEEVQAVLKKNSYKAYTRRVSTKKGRAIRVFVGPKFSRQTLAKDKKVIDKLLKVNSLVVPFEP